MRVLIYSHSYLDEENQKNVLALRPRAIPTCLIPTHGTVLLSPNAQFYSSDRTGTFYPLMPIRLFRSQYFLLPKSLRALARMQPNIINVEYNPWSIMFAQALILRKVFWHRARIVCTVKQNTFARHRNLQGYIKEKFCRHMLDRADHIVCASQSAATLLEKRFQFARTKISVCTHQGVDIELFYPRRENSLQSPNREFVVGYCGRFDDRKGVPTLIDAVARLRTKTLQPVCLKMLGTHMESGSDRAQLIELQSKHTWLEILPPVAHSKVPEFLRSLDIFVMPSRRLVDHEEQDAQALTEALACGLPSVGTRSGIIPELLDNRFGSVVEPDDPEALSDAILRFIVNNDVGLNSASAARRAALDNYALDVVAKRKLDIFEEVINRGK